MEIFRFEFCPLEKKMSENIKISWMKHTKQLFNFQIHNIVSASYLQANSC